MNTGLTAQWHTVKLGQIANVGTGGTPSRSRPEYYESGNNLWVKTQELRDVVIHDTEEKITDSAIKNSNAKIYPAGAVILAMYGATVGKLGISGKAITTNQACAVIQAIPNRADNNFIFYSLLANRKALISQARGAAQQNLSVGLVKDFEISLPDDLEEQKRIAEILMALDEKIENNKSIIRTSENIAQALFKKYFPANQEGETASLSDYVSHIKTQITPAHTPHKIFNHYSIPAFDNNKTPVQETGSSIMSNKFVVKERTVLFSKLNPSTPRVWLALTVLDGSVCSTEFLVLKPRIDADLSFVYGFLKFSSHIRELTNSVQGTSTSHQRLRPEDILSVKFPKPTSNTLDLYNQFMKPLSENVENSELENQRLVALRNLILPRLMNGTIKT